MKSPFNHLFCTAFATTDNDHRDWQQVLEPDFRSLLRRLRLTELCGPLQYLNFLHVLTGSRRTTSDFAFQSKDELRLQMDTPMDTLGGIRASNSRRNCLHKSGFVGRSRFQLAMTG